ncbi:MAG: hypothetical protein F6K16_30780 [Symploca sp. SIO2B6]|nr:hypothetical protein [Symploca sp. SIO2B6]
MNSAIRKIKLSVSQILWRQSICWLRSPLSLHLGRSQSNLITYNSFNDDSLVPLTRITSSRLVEILPTLLLPLPLRGK